MKRFLRPLLALGLGLPLLALAPLSAALDTNTVGADARWLVHLDFDALKKSTFGKELLIQMLAMQARAGAAQKSPGASAIQSSMPRLMDTLAKVTAYGTNLSQDPARMDGALILQGTPDLRKIAEGIVDQAAVTTPDILEELKDLPFEAYSVGGELFVAFPPEPIILVSKSKAQLLNARAVFLGQAKSLAQADSPLRRLIRNENDSFLIAASVVPSEQFFPENAPQARILRMAKSASLEIGETDGQVFAHGQLLAASDEMAEKLLKIVEGMTAMLSLAETNDRYLAEFMKSVTVKREQNTVTLHLAHASERLAQVFIAAQAAERGGKAKDTRRSSPPEAVIVGRMLATWTGDQNTNPDPAKALTLLSKTIKPVALQSGSLLVLTGVSDAGEHGRIDRVDITPAGGGAPLRFEAEYMNLKNYREEAHAAASGGKWIRLRSEQGAAEFRFPGADGQYTITVVYCDESDGRGTFALSVIAPETPATEANP